LNSSNSPRQDESAARSARVAYTEHTSAGHTSAAAQASAFATLDDIAQHPGCHGVVRLNAEPTAFASLGRHIERRARQLGRTVLVASAPAADAWQQLARRVGALEDDNTDALHVAMQLANDTRGTVLVVAEHRHTNWGATLRDELARLARVTDRAMLLVVLRPLPQGPLPKGPLAKELQQPATIRSAALNRSASAFDKTTAGQGPIEIELTLEELDANDRRRWWSALVAQDGMLNQPRFHELDALDAWWESTRRRPSQDQALPRPSGAAGLLLNYLHAAEQALSPAQVLELGTSGSIRDEHVDELLGQGAARRDWNGALVVSAEYRFEPLTRSARHQLAEVLSTCALGKICGNVGSS